MSVVNSEDPERAGLFGVRVLNQRALELIEPLHLQILGGVHVAVKGIELVRQHDGSLFPTDEIGAPRIAVPTELFVVTALHNWGGEEEVAALQVRTYGGEDILFGASLPGFSVLPVVD